ncbi:MAG: lycopene beta-cyclase CrtY [Pseudomonadota bacterium]
MSNQSSDLRDHADHRALDADLILVGGGLANGLIAWRLDALRPELRVRVLEAGDALGADHTWSFHDSDLNESQHRWIAPLVAHRWARHSVAFPELRRRLDSGYASITGERFDAVLRPALGDRVQLNTAVSQVGPDRVMLADGSELRARAVIDGRGARPSPHLALGFQKFLGHEVRLDAPHGLQGPTLMDASVAQQDGYRFVYLLPFSPDTLLVEDTFYTDDPALDLNRLRHNIAAYVRARGWTVAELLREERGVLPILLDGDFEAYWKDAKDVPQSGMSAGLFHPTTGYSLPEAVRLADLLCTLPDLSARPLFRVVRRHAEQRWHAQGFYRMLNRMLFRAAAPADRWRMMQRFYRLPEPLIQRFYAGRLRMVDKARILTGKPPVPIPAALRAVFSTPARRALAREGSA